MSNNRHFKIKLFQMILNRFLEAFEKMNNDEISSDLQKEFLEWCHQFINSYDGTDSWFNSASSSFHEFWECAGNQYIVWEKGGYRTILSIMMVIYYKNKLKCIDFY